MSENLKQKERCRPRRRTLWWTLAIIAVAGAAMAYLFIGQWAGVTEVPSTEVDQVFAAARVEAGGGTPYIEITDQGEVVVHRELEPERPGPFGTLTLLVWSPGDGRMLRVDYPHWSVRLKTSTFLNLGTMLAAVRKDWAHLDLGISYRDLRNRGPAMLLDNQSAGGARILLWTSPRSGGPTSAVPTAG